MLADTAVLATMAFAAFTAATILPGSSEVVFASILAAGYEKPLYLFIVATIANTAGSMTNWAIGMVLAQGADTDRGHHLIERFRLPPDMLQRMHDLFERWGWWALLFSWLPLIGDPLTIVAGMARYPFWTTLTLSLIGRAVRYAAIWAGTAGMLKLIWG